MPVLRWSGAAAPRRPLRVRLVVAALLGVVAAGPATSGAEARLPGQELTPSGMRRHTAVYVTMRDGVEIAVDVWLPADHRQGDRRATLMRTTRYWRGNQLGWAARMLAALHLMHFGEEPQRASFNRRGFVVLQVDARGSGASGGRRISEYSPDEVADLGEVAAWAARQPWSNGRVGTFGVSYDGDTAELAAVPNQPAIRAVMPLYDDFDSQALVLPGGVLLSGFIEPWSTAVAGLDRNDVCAVAQQHGLKCWLTRQVVPGVRRVDADPHGKHLAALVRQHRNLDVAAAVSKAEYRDDALAVGHGELRFEDISPYGQRHQIEAAAVPMMVWCGWMDASPCEGALIRYHTFSNPQVVVIGPLSHGGSFNADPFTSSHVPPVPSRDEQFKMEADFFAQLLLEDPPRPVASTIRYYTMGEGSWHTTAEWPPPGFPVTKLYFADGGGLSDTPPPMAPASDRYEVDFTASSGTRTRWHTQLGGGDVVYADRAGADRKLLTYTSQPLPRDVELTGSPVLTLSLTSTASDGAVHAYLEDVAPEGRVTYLDEGVFRLIHRKEVDPKTLPYAPLGPAHSFLRRDAEPLRPGEVTTVRFALYPTSIVVRKGHRLRIALAGADAGLFARYPAAGAVTWTVHREPDRASFLELPLKPR
jgi:putative CocE/NonD family hydrolase